MVHVKFFEVRVNQFIGYIFIILQKLLDEFFKTCLIKDNLVSQHTPKDFSMLLISLSSCGSTLATLFIF